MKRMGPKTDPWGWGTPQDKGEMEEGVESEMTA